ncbi:hypothetical protein [Kitasatospora kazusensis]
MTTATISPAIADGGPTGGVNPCAVNDICIGIVEPGGNPSHVPVGPGGGGGSGGDGVQMCSWNLQQWPCWDNDLGWFNTSDGCYYQRSDPQPPAGDPSWGGHDPASGAVYEVNCRLVGGGLTPKPPMFFASPPGGAPPPDDPVALGRQAADMIRLAAPVVHAAPGGTALVGAPVWLWYDRTVGSAGPQSATVRGRQISVTATAVLKNVHWDTGDGSPGLDCATSGTAYTPGAPANATDCSYLYKTGSALQSDHMFYLTAVATWHITATVAGRQDQVLGFDYQVPADRPLPLRVGELQVLNN